MHVPSARTVPASAWLGDSVRWTWPRRHEARVPKTVLIPGGHVHDLGKRLRQGFVYGLQCLGAQAGFACPDDRLRTVHHLELAENVGDMIAHGFGTQHQMRRQLW